MNVAIVDYGGGNVGSVRMAFERLGADCRLTANAEEICSAERVVLPGVGAAGFAMERLRALCLDQPLTMLERPALGICVGMQLLFEHSEEEDVACLGIVEGSVRKLEPGSDCPVPHMGWSRLDVSGGDIGIASGDYVYFAHSYAGDVSAATVASANHVKPFAAAVRQGNWLGAQFHPERSGEAGARFLESFLA